MPRSDSICCSFCGKSSAEVRKLIAGPGVYICDSCIVVCGRILAKELPEPCIRPPRVLPIVFHNSAAEVQASLKTLRAMKREKAISEDEYIALSRRLLVGLTDEKIAAAKTKSTPQTKTRAQAAGR